MTNYSKYLEVLNFFDIKEDGRIFKIENNLDYKKMKWKYDV